MMFVFRKMQLLSKNAHFCATNNQRQKCPEYARQTLVVMIRSVHFDL